MNMEDETTSRKEVEDIVVHGWHLKKEVTIGQLVTILVILVSGLWWASSVETRFAQLNAEDKRIEEKTQLVFNHMNSKFDVYQKDIERALGRIDRSIGKLSDKIDKKADK